jgi:hypothetical protein
MDLSSVRGLKLSLSRTVLGPLIAGAGLKGSAVAAGPIAGPQPSLALGIVRKGPGDYHLAVRYQRREMEHSREVRAIERQAAGEVDIRYIGLLEKITAPKWPIKPHRPLRLGTSIGHHQVTAGTLGCLVKDRKDETTLLLSNNHVLANENRARVGDAILQPGALDGGKNPEDVVATLEKMVKLKKTGSNPVDCAVARPLDRIAFDARTIHRIGRLKGVGPEFLDEGMVVQKYGRTTELTRGRVTAFELDELVVRFDIGQLRFHNQIEIEGAGEGPFGAGGDSGSLIVDGDRQAVALLFAAGQMGGSNGQGLTYANPIHSVLDAQGVDLLT